MKNLILSLVLAASVGLAGCVTTGETDETDYGYYLAVLAIGTDLANETGGLIITAGNVTEAGGQQIVHASDATTDVLVDVLGLYEAYLLGDGSGHNVFGGIINATVALEALYDLAQVEGSPFHGQSAISIIGQLAALSVPEMLALRTARQDAEAAGTAIPLDVVREMVTNAVGSEGRLRAAFATAWPPDE